MALRYGSYFLKDDPDGRFLCVVDLCVREKILKLFYLLKCFNFFSERLYAEGCYSCKEVKSLSCVENR